jgi:uncharacterized membrane-anchored protein
MRATALLISIVFLALGNIPAHSQENATLQKVQALSWKDTAAPGNIAGKATFKLDGGLRLLDAPSTSEFLTLLGNLPQANSYIVAKRNLEWFSVFSFAPEGYVVDDEKIDADALLKALKERNAQSESERKSKGLPSLFLEGWFIPPRYDEITKRIEWATLLRNDGGEKTVNFSTKILGRSGHMSVILVSDPERLNADIKEFKSALTGFEFVQGERYAEWKQGDKVAAYGLGALVLGGAAAVATKKGLWAVLGGLLAAGWKVLAGLAVAAVAGLISFFKKKTP